MITRMSLNKSIADSSCNFVSLLLFYDAVDDKMDIYEHISTEEAKSSNFQW